MSPVSKTTLQNNIKKKTSMPYANWSCYYKKRLELFFCGIIHTIAGVF